MTDAVTLVLDATGLVVRAGVGTPGDVAVEAGETAVLRDGAAAAAWLGWTRASDGTWRDPAAPLPDTPETLAAYARAASFTYEAAGIQVGDMRVATDRPSQGLIDRAVGLLAADPTLSGVDYDAGGPVLAALTREQVTGVAIAVGRHVQRAFARRGAALRGIAAGTVTTRAAVDAIFAAA